MNLLNKLTIKNLKLNKKRTIVTIVGILLSVALMTAVSTIYASTIASLIHFETTQKGNFHTAFYDVPVDKIEDLKENRKIEDVYLTQGIGYAVLENGKNEYKPYLYVKAFTKEAMENLSLKLTDGRFPETEDEIVISSHIKTDGRVAYKVGDTLTLEVGTRVDQEGNILTQDDFYLLPSDDEDEEGKIQREEIIDSQLKTYKIVGIIERPASNVENYSAPGYTVVTLLDDTKLEGKIDVYAKYNKKGIQDYYEVTAGILGIDAKKLKAYLNGSGFTSQEEATEVYEEIEKAKYSFMDNLYLVLLQSNPFQNEAVGGLGVAVVIVILIIVFTSIFCIKNSFDISIVEKTKQYGMLRSIGATKKQIKKNVFYEASLLGLIGIPLGLFCGLIASYILVIVSNYFLEDMITSGVLLHFEFSWVALFIAVLLGIVTIYFSAFRSARRASKVSPIDSIRNSANIKIKAKKISCPKWIQKVFGIGGVISYKNQKRNKRKYRTTIISIILSVTTFLALSSFMSLAFSEIEHEIWLSDYNLSAAFSLEKDDDDFYKRIEGAMNLDNIKDYTIYSSYFVEFLDAKINPDYVQAMGEPVDSSYYDTWIAVVGKHQYEKYLRSLSLNPEEMKGKAILLDTSEFELYDSHKEKSVDYRMRIFDYQKGDKIKFSLRGQEEELEIGYVSDVAPFAMKELFRNRMSGYLLVSDEYFKEKGILSHVILYIDSNNANQLQDDLEEYFYDVSGLRINNQSENVRIMRNLYTLIGIFLYGFIIVISLIGITNIFNTITTNMELRKQEFAMLKSIGMTNFEFKKMIYLESIFIGTKALFFGTIFGLGLSYLIYKSIGDQTYPYELPILAIFISMIAVFLLIIVLMRYSMKKIQKQNTIETIRNENI